MKKETIFKHELNESIQANAAMNCLKNRNKPQQNEGFLMSAGIWVLKKIVFHLVMKAIKKYGSQIDFSKVMDSVANGLAEQKGALQKAVGKAVNGWQDLPEKYKNQITELAKEKFNELKSAAGEKINQLTSKGQPQLATQEQEETSDFDARFELRKDLRELASPAAKKAYMIIRKQYGDSMWRQLGMDDCDEQGLIDMLNMYAEDGLNPQQIVNKMMGVREDEETVDYAQLADDVCASYRGPLSKLDLKDSINYIIKMVAKKIGKTVDALTPQELSAIQKAAKHSVWYVSEQEEDTLQAYYSQDEPDYENDHHGIWLIINLMRKMGMLRAQGIEGRDDVDDGHAIDRAYDLIEQKLDEEGMWIGDDDHEAERFVSFFGDEIAAEAMKSAIHNQEQEEMTGEDDRKMWKDIPQMEQRDIILAVSEYLAECWIDTGDDGDLDDIYYAVEYLLDSKPKSKECPQSPAWEDCKPWCSRHYKDVEEQITAQF